MEYFLKKTHINIMLYIIFAYITIFILLIFILLKNKDMIIIIFITYVFITSITVLLIKYYNSMGLYISKYNIYYKKVLSRKIDIKEIKGIKIIKAYSVGGKYKGFLPLKDNKGHLLYSAIFLNTITEGMDGFSKGDLWFNYKYKKYIICSVTYDRTAVEYLKKLNPNIKILM